MMKSVITKENIDKMEEAIKRLPDPDVSHGWHDGEFSLLFHASLTNCLPAVRLLLEAGADPLWLNDSESCVSLLFAKRGQIDMADLCYDRLSKIARSEFINAATEVGKSMSMSKQNIIFLFYIGHFFFDRVDAPDGSGREQQETVRRMVTLQGG
jgi:hypothetical protein